MNRVLKQNELTSPGNRTSSKQKGFTLIEIAIVLVIIGLLLGGVLKGQELINTARVRALNNSVDGITAAWFSFQDRYRAFPGDYSQAAVNLPGTPANGDGNGLVDSAVERAMVWMHLQQAGYITGVYNNAAATVPNADEYNCPVTVCPDNGFGAGMNLSYGELRQAQTGTLAHELITGRGIPVEVIAELDRKVDDGIPSSGAMQLGIGGSNWLDADATACQNITIPDPDLYGVQTPSANCAAVFRNF
jgi:prepilin-type N-terminal cleavage/methylation domain-containing protein